MTPDAWKGLLLGWSIAWPPGPINAEMIRRGLARGFWSAWTVGLGACSADFLWALGVALAAGQMARSPQLERMLGVVSIALLLFMAWTFLRGAWAGWKAHRAGNPLPELKRLQSAGGGWLVGFSLAMTSPWGIAFWLAIFGQQGEALGLERSLVLASGVIVGASLWGLALCTGVRMGARFATPMWQVTTQGLTGLLMLYFAGSALWRLAGP